MLNALGFALLGLVICLAMSANAADAPPAERVFEMRTYYAADGKMEDMHNRFRNHTNKLFVKHGMTLIGYWVPLEGQGIPNTMVYILAYPSKEAQEKAWKDFRADPDWVKAKADSEVNGKLVARVDSVLLKPTDYSPIK